MSKIMDMVSMRLGDKELASLEIDRLIKDVSNLIGGKRRFDSAGLKMALQRLGWKENVLDYRTMELIFLFLEDEGKFDN
ncbi:hypothetical protein ACFL03_01725 [Thermodesulfobacteriota bacterium]